MKFRLLAATLAAFAALPALAQAASGVSTANVNMRSGPSTQYPAVVVIPRGMPIEVHGCLETANWCDVSFARGRGWVSGRYIQMTYGGNRVYVDQPQYRRLGIPTVIFNLDDYWGRNYRQRDFYRQRDEWRGGPDRRPQRPPMGQGQYDGNRQQPGWGNQPPPPGWGNQPPPPPGWGNQPQQPGAGNRPRPQPPQFEQQRPRPQPPQAEPQRPRPQAPQPPQVEPQRPRPPQPQVEQPRPQPPMPPQGEPQRPRPPQPQVEQPQPPVQQPQVEQPRPQPPMPPQVEQRPQRLVPNPCPPGQDCAPPANSQ